MKRVFFFTYYYPPIGGVASLRNVKLANYLLDFGWEPVVFHGGKGAVFPADPALVNQVNPAIRRIAVRTLEAAAINRLLDRRGLRRLWAALPLLFLPDPQIAWTAGTIRAAEKDMREHGRPDAVFTSAAPFSANLAGLHFKTRHGIPWIADFQDEWTFNPAARFLTPLHRRFAEHYERATFNESDVLTTVTPPLVERFGRERPPGKPVALLRDGYDEADFAGAPPAKLADKWTLAYIGTAYASIDPKPILEELTALIRAGKIDGARVRVAHAGRGQIRWPDDSPFEKKVLGFVPHEEAVRWMREAHALIILREHPGASSGRIYEYMRAETPIISMGRHDSELSRLLADTGAGAYFPFDNRAALREHLLQSWLRWESGATMRPREVSQQIEAYSRRSEARELAALLDRVAVAGPVS